MVDNENSVVVVNHLNRRCQPENRGIETLGSFLMAYRHQFLWHIDTEDHTFLEFLGPEPLN